MTEVKRLQFKEISPEDFEQFVRNGKSTHETTRAITSALRTQADEQ